MAQSIKGHTFRVTQPYQDRAQDVYISAGECGIIDAVSPDGTQVSITIRSRSKPASFKQFPTANLEVGALFIAGTRPLPIILTGPLFDSLRISRDTISDQANQENADPFKKAVAFFLQGLREHHARLPQFTHQQRRLFENDSAITQTAQRMRNNVANANPNFFNVIRSKNFTIDDILRNLSKADTKDQDAGIYLGIFDNFKTGSSRHGSLPYAYVGQSQCIGERLKSHNSTASSKERGQFVHQVMREADRHRWFKLAKHPGDEGGSDKAGKAMRDVMETIFMLFFSTMQSRVMLPSTRLSGEFSQDIATSYDAQESAKLYTEIAKDACSKAQYSLPSTPGRKPFGLSPYGCNYSLPLGGEQYLDWGRTLWVRQTMEKRWVFHRAPLKLKKDKRVASLAYRNHEPNQLSLMIQPTAEELDAMKLKINDEYYAVWEVMRPGEGTHPVPFFRLCEIGCWSNWYYANKVAFKLVWFSTKDNKWKTKYLQRQGRHRFVENCTGLGALLDYSLGVGIYEYFVRSRFPDAQPWSANFGQAKIVAVQVNHFEQTITLSHMASAADKLRGPTCDPNVPRVAMEKLGLQNVNSPFKGFDWGWLEQSNFWKGGVITKDKKECRGFKGRTKCDYCFLAERVSPLHMFRLAFTKHKLTGFSVLIFQHA